MKQIVVSIDREARGYASVTFNGFSTNAVLNPDSVTIAGVDAMLLIDHVNRELEAIWNKERATRDAAQDAKATRVETIECKVSIDSDAARQWIETVKEAVALSGQVKSPDGAVWNSVGTQEQIKAAWAKAESLENAVLGLAGKQQSEPIHHDYRTHHNDFREACRIARSVSTAQEDRAYWQKQCDTLDNINKAYETNAATVDSDAHSLPADCDVRKIMLDVVPADGEGHEIYAKSNKDIEETLSKMGQELEEWQLGIRRLAPTVPQCPPGPVVSLDSILRSLTSLQADVAQMCNRESGRLNGDRFERAASGLLDARNALLDAVAPGAALPVAPSAGNQAAQHVKEMHKEISDALNRVNDKMVDMAGMALTASQKDCLRIARANVKHAANQMFRMGVTTE